MTKPETQAFAAGATAQLAAFVADPSGARVSFPAFLGRMAECLMDFAGLAAYAGRFAAARCWKLGQAVRRAIDSFSGDRHVAIVGTGGLSHQVHGERAGFNNEEWDHRFLELLQHEPQALTKLTCGSAAWTESWRCSRRSSSFTRMHRGRWGACKSIRIDHGRTPDDHRFRRGARRPGADPGSICRPQSCNRRASPSFSCRSCAAPHRRRWHANLSMRHATRN